MCVITDRDPLPVLIGQVKCLSNRNPSIFNHPQWIERSYSPDLAAFYPHFFPHPCPYIRPPVTSWVEKITSDPVQHILSYFFKLKIQSVGPTIFFMSLVDVLVSLWLPLTVLAFTAVRTSSGSSTATPESCPSIATPPSSYCHSLSSSPCSVAFSHAAGLHSGAVHHCDIVMLCPATRTTVLGYSSVIRCTSYLVPFLATSLFSLCVCPSNSNPSLSFTSGNYLFGYSPSCSFPYLASFTSGEPNR